ncbi:ABC transporter permease [Aquihabitans sp. G128]|uniref:ABC transporter permease n=1 Tax=Aquihabitans sp. G128 TaxID=2849779 RepID=UPI001C218B3F|nr:ABC transporter permease [Aquihabitans sp. G128]QXC61722.1 ABC transporter permease [Aquihabitans sp. G128]
MDLTTPPGHPGEPITTGAQELVNVGGHATTSEGEQGVAELAGLEGGLGGDGAGGEPVDLDASLYDVGPSRSLAADAWRRFRRNRLAMFGLLLVAFLLLVAIVGPFVVKDPLSQRGLSRERPTNQHWFGTDRLGRDVFARVVYGVRLSLFIGFVATAVETLIGIVVGAIAGWFRGWSDTILMRFVDILLGIPYFVLALVMVTIIGKGLAAVIITLAITAWLQTARTVRAGFLQVRELEYVEAAKAIGVPTKRIIIRHVLPNVFQPVIVLVAVGIGSAILAEAALSFLGVGISDPTPSLGLMVAQAQTEVTTSFYLLFFPAMGIVITVLGFLLVGDGLRDALDVKDI